MSKRSSVKNSFFKPRRMKTAGFLKAEDQTFILLLKDIIIGLTAAAAKQDKRF